MQIEIEYFDGWWLVFPRDNKLFLKWQFYSWTVCGKGSREQVIKSYLENKRGFFVLWGSEKKKNAGSDAVLLFRYLLPLKRRLREKPEIPS